MAGAKTPRSSQQNGVSSSNNGNSNKKQASLMSFFTPKTATATATTTTTTTATSREDGPASSSPVRGSGLASSPSVRVSSSRLPTRKRPLEEEEADEPPKKKDSRASRASRGQAKAARVRARARVEEEEEGGEELVVDDEDDEDYQDNQDNQDKDKDKTGMEEEAPKSSPRRSSGRTERYLYEEKEIRDSREEADEDEDEVTRQEKEERHRRFVKKLGHPDSMAQLRRRRWAKGEGGEETGEGEADGEDEEDGGGEGQDEGDGEDEEEERPRGKKKTAARGKAKPAKPTSKGGAKAAKLTPMEEQFLAIKRQHRDTLLVVEVGYKFRFFGEDARVAGRELGIVCVPGRLLFDPDPSEAHLDRFASASIPVPRLGVHVRRLVAAGHKVGVVRQMETAALKKAGDNRNAPFVRRLTNVYTKGTFVEEDEADDETRGKRSTASVSRGGYILCLTETSSSSSSSAAAKADRVEMGLLAVQASTGDILHDRFEDGFLRSELETRLLHIAPVELIMVGQLSAATEKLVQHLSGSAANVFGDRTRVERVAEAPRDAESHVMSFYSEQARAEEAEETEETEKTDKADKADKKTLLDQVLGLPAVVTTCLSAMITHLSEYGLEHVFALTRNFGSFTTQQHMLLSGTTLESLEVYRNATDHGVRGSLLWALDKTRTRAGHRLLRKWIGRPLLDAAALTARVDAVEELLQAAGSARRDRLEGLFQAAAAGKNDLERSLIRIYYGKCSRPELVAVLQTLQRIAQACVRAGSGASLEFRSLLIRRALDALPAMGDVVVEFLERLDGEAARQDDKYGFFREAWETEAMTNHKMGIAAVEMDLEAQRAEIAATLGGKKKQAPAYVTVAGIEYLVEVANGSAELRQVPASWIKISGTKKVSRFHTPAVVRLLGERDQHKEALAAACDAAFADLQQAVAAQYEPLRAGVAALATLDCLLSLARVAALPGYVRPTMVEEEDKAEEGGQGAMLDIRGGRHPVAEHTLPGGYIPFSMRMGRTSPRGHVIGDAVDMDGTDGADTDALTLLITGPNMGGKSSFVRAVALLVLLAQIGSFVPADAMAWTLADGVFTRMGARDNLFAGESTFLVELSETAAILRAATPRSLVLLDELGRGTSTHDGAAIAHAVLAHVARDLRCRTLFITHYQSLARVADGLRDEAEAEADGQGQGKGQGRPLVQNVHMRFTSDDDDDGSSSLAEPSAHASITFLYEVAPGIAHRSYGLNVARLARIPQRVLDVAAQKSRELEHDVRVRVLRAAAHLTHDLLAHPADASADTLDHLVSSIEQL